MAAVHLEFEDEVHGGFGDFLCSFGDHRCSQAKDCRSLQVWDLLLLPSFRVEARDTVAQAELPLEQTLSSAFSPPPSSTSSSLPQTSIGSSSASFSPAASS